MIIKKTVKLTKLGEYNLGVIIPKMFVGLLELNKGERIELQLDLKNKNILLVPIEEEK